MHGADDHIYLKDSLTKDLYILCDDLARIQVLDSTKLSFGALYCSACSDYHSRAAESVLPFAVAYTQSGDRSYLRSAIATGNWLVRQQRADGSWIETPSEWTGTTTDQLLSLATAYSVIKKELTEKESREWSASIKNAADWLVKNMNQEFATINYCATTTASLTIAFQIVHDSTYVVKAKTLAEGVMGKFDQDYFLTGEGNRIRGTKYGVDPGYNLDMSLWGLGLYAKFTGNKIIENSVKQSLQQQIYFIYPDGSVDDSWGVRSNKWITYGSLTADGCQVAFSLYAHEFPMFAQAAVMNADYFMSMRVNGLLTYGQNYYDMFSTPPCIYPTFCRAKSLALAILFGDQGEVPDEKYPSLRTGWSKYFNTIDVAVIRTKNFMATVSGYRYKDIRRGADFKYMFRPSGGSITNLWASGYGYVQASSPTEYHQWESNFPPCNNCLSITPRIEFTDSNAYYTNLFEFDSHMSMTDSAGSYTVESWGELKDRNRWEGGVAYVLRNTLTDTYIEKDISLRFHGQRPEVDIVEPIVTNNDTKFKKLDSNTIEISGGERIFIFQVFGNNYSIENGTDENKYAQPFPSLKGYPLIIRVFPDSGSIYKNVRYRLSIKNNTTNE